MKNNKMKKFYKKVNKHLMKLLKMMIYLVNSKKLIQNIKNSKIIKLKN